MTPPQTTRRACVFCGSTENKISGEHVFADWIRPHLSAADPGEGTHHHITLKHTDKPVVRKWPAEAVTQEVNSVCEPCNNGWMSDLENEAKPFLIPLIEGRFYAGGAAVLSRWAMKTSLVVASGFKPETPASLFHDFYAKRKPPPGTRIWIGTNNVRNMHYVDHRPLSIVVTEGGYDPNVTYRGYASTLAVGGLCFYLLTSEVGEPIAHDFGGKFSRALVRLWPVSGWLNWPPPLIIGGLKDLDALADTSPGPDELLHPSRDSVP